MLDTHPNPTISLRDVDAEIVRCKQHQARYAESNDRFAQATGPRDCAPSAA